MAIIAALIGGLLVLTLCVYGSLRPLPDTLVPHATAAKKRQVVDRNGAPLSYTFSSGWNLGDIRPLFSIPIFLQHAFVEAEDRRFYQHSGVDWRARLHALWQNVRSLRSRG